MKEEGCGMIEEAGEEKRPDGNWKQIWKNGM